VVTAIGDTARGATATAGTTVLVDSIVELTFAVHSVLTRAAAEQDLSVTQLRLLGMLRDRTPPMTVIAHHLGLDRSSVTGLIDRAEGRGLVARIASIADARVTTVRITAKGRRVGGQVGARVTAEIERLVEHLPKADRDCLVRVAAVVLPECGVRND
jgi:MarR family transcriptional regulator, lower aerobic nicotinate degradation pathway regulator